MFIETKRQKEANAILGGQNTHGMLFGGGRSGKTLKIIRMIVMRACASPGSLHAIFRLHFNHVKASIVAQTFPMVMEKCFPNVNYELNRSDWYAEIPNGSQIWFGGLDDKERTEKILGQEFISIYLNECSQLRYAARNMAITRLAQKCFYNVNGRDEIMRLRMWYDCNPPSKKHWTYLLFVKKIDPDTKRPLKNPEDYGCMRMNPIDNMDNLPEAYISQLDNLPGRMRKRFRDGEFTDQIDGALWTIEIIESNRVTLEDVPDLQRIVIAVDPSGASDDEDSTNNDEIGIIAAGIGVDGIAYILHDKTCSGGPSKWGKVTVDLYDKLLADRVVGEENYGGGMVKYVIRTHKPGISYKSVRASKGKAVRAEPVSALSEQGRIKFVGQFTDLEDELCDMTAAGYKGPGSPNRVDALVWAITDLFPNIINKQYNGSIDVSCSVSAAYEGTI